MSKNTKSFVIIYFHNSGKNLVQKRFQTSNGLAAHNVMSIDLQKL